MSNSNASSAKKNTAATDTAVEEPKLSTVPEQAAGEDQDVVADEKVSVKEKALTLLKAQKHVVVGLGAAAVIATVAVLKLRAQKSAEAEQAESSPEEA